MTLIDVLPKDFEGNIILNPAGEYKGDYVEGSVNPSFLEKHFSEISSAELPLSEDLFEQLKRIDRFWKINAEKWRENGLI